MFLKGPSTTFHIKLDITDCNSELLTAAINRAYTLESLSPPSECVPQKAGRDKAWQCLVAMKVMKKVKVNVHLCCWELVSADSPSLRQWGQQVRWRAVGLIYTPATCLEK